MLVPTVRGWWRRRRYRPSTRTRVALPAVVDVPPDVLRVLRELDPRLDLYPMPSGVVMLIRKTDQPARIDAGRKLLELFRPGNGDVDIEPMWMEQLMAEGFEWFSDHPWHEGMSAGAMLARAQRVLYASERAVKEDMQERRAESDSTRSAERRAKVIIDRIRSGARWDHARTYRGAKQFAYGGR